MACENQRGTAWALHGVHELALKKVKSQQNTGLIYLQVLTCYKHSYPQRNLVYFLWGHAVAKWLRNCATNRKVAGSVPDGVTGFFH
jgi:hypothetical protein